MYTIFSGRVLYKVSLTLLGSLGGFEPSPLFEASGLFKTPTGTITLGVEVMAPP